MALTTVTSNARIDHPVLQQHLLTLRDEKTDPEYFRRSLEAITYLLLGPALSGLKTEETSVQTPLATAYGRALYRDVALVPILRAGLGMLGPAQTLLPQAKVFMAGMYRNEKTLEPVWYRHWLPKRDGDQFDWFILDVMLATGGSAVATIEAIKAIGGEDITFVGVIAAPEGLAKLSQAHPDVRIIVGAVDKRLTTADDVAEDPELRSGYIVPGLGDAGDRQFNI